MRYKITGGRYGGEVAIGRVSDEFFENYGGMESDELVEKILEIEETDEMDGRCWWDIDDVEHINAAYSDGGFVVYPINENGDEDWDNEIRCDGNHLYGREAYSYTGEEDHVQGQLASPVLSFHSFEKGGFGDYYVETEEPFNPEKLFYSTVETDVGEFIDEVYYDQQQLEADYDYADTTGKGYYASCGLLVEKWHDKRENFTPEYVKELFEEWVD